jgi:hypothetical protein
MAIISNGTTMLNSGAFSASLGSMVLLSEQTASGASSVNFTSGINSTYPIYLFQVINGICSNDGRSIDMNFSTNGGSTYSVTKTSTAFFATHFESGSGGSVSYNTGKDLAQSTSDQSLNFTTQSNPKGSMSGTILLFNPSSTTFVKHYITHTNGKNDDNSSNNGFLSGYCNTTSAINAVKFDTFDGTIDGTFKMYGIKDS